MSAKKSETTEEGAAPQKEAAADKPVAAVSEQKAAEPKASFKTLSLLSGKVQIEMPEQLQPMDAEMFRLKYPMENAETTKAYSNEEGTVSLLISPRQEKATQADLPKYQQMLRESFGKNPSVEFKKNEIKKINGRDFIVIKMIMQFNSLYKGTSFVRGTSKFRGETIRIHNLVVKEAKSGKNVYNIMSYLQNFFSASSN